MHKNLFEAFDRILNGTEEHLDGQVVWNLQDENGIFANLAKQVTSIWPLHLLRSIRVLCPLKFTFRIY